MTCKNILCEVNSSNLKILCEEIIIKVPKIKEYYKNKSIADFEFRLSNFNKLSKFKQLFTKKPIHPEFDRYINKFWKSHLYYFNEELELAKNLLQSINFDPTIKINLDLKQYNYLLNVDIYYKNIIGDNINL